MNKDDRKLLGELLRDLNTYLPILMNYLWEQHKVVAGIIKNSEIKDLKEYLARLLAWKN